MILIIGVGSARTESSFRLGKQMWFQDKRVQNFLYWKNVKNSAPARLVRTAENIAA